MRPDDNPYAPPEARLSVSRGPTPPPVPSVARRIVGILVGGLGVDVVLGLTVATFVGGIVGALAGGSQSVLFGTTSVLALVFSVLGGYTAAYIAPWRPLVIGLLAGILSSFAALPVLFVVGASDVGGLDIVGMVLHFPLAAWGGRLGANAHR